MELKDFIDNQMGKNKDTIIRVGQKSGDKQIKAKNLHIYSTGNIKIMIVVKKDILKDHI